MLCSLLDRELGLLCRSVLRFLDRSVSGAMGCFFGCFRVKDDRHLRSRPHLVSQSSRNNQTVRFQFGSRENVSSSQCLFLLFCELFEILWNFEEIRVNWVLICACSWISLRKKKDHINFQFLIWLLRIS